MTIKEMEIQIDRLGLEELEVRLWKGNQVDVFICAIKEDEEGEFDDENQHRGNIVVFDGHGKCYETTPLALWTKGDEFEMTYAHGIDDDLPETINGYDLERIPERDLEDLSA